MNHRHPATPFWSTASFGDDSVPADQSGLSEHFVSCQGSNGGLVTLQCMAEAANRFITARFVTTLVVAAFAMGVASFLL